MSTALSSKPTRELVLFEEKIREAILGSDPQTRRQLENLRTKVLDEVRNRL